MRLIKTLVHLHTDYSYDSDISLERLARYVEEENIGCVAITDHDTIEGAQRFRRMTSARVIIGEEITTTDGHLIGLFLTERVAPGMSAEDTAAAIRAQGGIVLLPHPFVRAFSCGLLDRAHDIAHLVDAVEVNNAQNVRRRPDREAERFADRHDLPGYVGADSHMSLSIAPCYQYMADFDGPEQFVRSLRTAKLVRGIHPLAFFVATGLRLLAHLAGLPLGGGFGANFEPAGEPAAALVPVPARVQRSTRI